MHNIMLQRKISTACAHKIYYLYTNLYIRDRCLPHRQNRQFNNSDDDDENVDDDIRGKLLYLTIFDSER